MSNMSFTSVLTVVTLACGAARTNLPSTNIYRFTFSLTDLTRL